MKWVVGVEVEVAVVVINDLTAFASAPTACDSLLTAIGDASSNAAVRAIVIIGTGSGFSAASDVREFGQALAEPQLPAVIAAIEACPKPVVAALQGSAIGGGFELALGCDARVALTGTVVSLPQVTLGIIPSAGGTQRLPRLTGIPRAIAFICSGECVAADKALSMGIVDKVVAADLRNEAIAWAKSMRGKKRVRDLATPASDQASIDEAAASAMRAGKNRPAVRAAIAAIKEAGTLPTDVGLANEHAAFQSLRTSREARALRHLFFAERDAATHPALEDARARPVRRIAVIGAGTMGAGIAIAALDSGFEVSLLEQQEAALKRGVDRVRGYHAGRVKAGKMAAAQATEREARLKAGLDWAVITAADLVIEAVFEDLTVKRAVFKRLDGLARPGAILASNTSYTDLDAIANATARPQDVVGLHFFSPAQVMRLLEIVRGAATAPDVVATCLKLAKSLHKIAVVSGNAFGFIGNRIYSAYRRQCEFMLEEGASPKQIDAALEAFGFAMGPFAVGDMSGLDIAWRMRQSQAATLDPASRYVRIPDLLCEAGRLGQKSSAGYYSYAKAGAPRQEDPAVAQIIAGARAKKGIVPRTIGDVEIVKRALLSMANEAALLLQEGVAERASDIDVVLISGYGFPKWEGGPVFWAQELGAATLNADLDWLAGVSGAGFVRGNAQQLVPPGTQAK